MMRFSDETKTWGGDFFGIADLDVREVSFWDASTITSEMMA